MAANPKPFITPESYLALERAATTRSEYLNGRVYAMTGASPAHNLIVGNLIVALGLALRPRPCTLYPSDQRVKVPATGLYTYPDISIVCGPARFDEDDRPESLTNPTLLIEVLSPSTEGYDRGQKAAHYRKLPSLQAYLLVAQDRTHLEYYSRQPDDQWLLTEAGDPADTLYLAAIDCHLVLAEVYAKVDWAEEDDPEREAG